MSYSKSRIDRAGESMADFLRALAEGRGGTPEQREAIFETYEVIEWWRSQHARPLSRVAANLRYYAADEGNPIVAQRLKKVPTIAHKLLREPKMKLSRMADIGGVRAVLPSQQAAYKVASRIRRNWTIVRFRDYVAEPKADGYRALHLINRHQGRLIEVQLRTTNQDRWANTVERVSRAVVPGLKFGGGPQEVADYFRYGAMLLALADQSLEVSPDLIAHWKSLQERAATFTGTLYES